MRSVFVLGLLAGAVAAQEWRTDLDKGRAEAKATGKPMLAVFR